MTGNKLHTVDQPCVTCSSLCSLHCASCYLANVNDVCVFSCCCLRCSSAVGKRVGRLAITIDTGRLSKLGCGGKCMKFYLYGMSIFLMCVGIAFLAAGAYVKNMVEFNEMAGSTLANGVIAAGVFLLLCGALGAGGAWNESRPVLTAFNIFMGLLFVMLLIMGAYAASKIGQESDIVGRAWINFDQDTKTTLQQALGCCGATSYYLATDINSLGCYKDVTYVFNANNPPATQYQCIQCCFPKLISKLKASYTGIGVAGIVIAVILISSLVASCVVVSGLNAHDEQMKKSKGKK